MQVKTNQSLSNLLQTTPELHDFVTKLEHLAQINSAIAQNLEATLANHCKVANLRDGALVLSTTSPAWHHKLRFSSMEILSMLRKDPRWSGLKSVEIRVDYLPSIESQTANGYYTKPRTLSTASRQLIEQTAANLTNPKLAAALARLAKI